MRRLIAVALITAIIASAASAYIAIRLTAQPEPDITVASCTMWATTQTPELPPYTRTDVCADNDGFLHDVH